MKTGTFSIALAGLLLAGCGGSGSDAPPVNSAPTISAIADQSITANTTSTAINFTVSDEQASALSFAISSDNQDVVVDGDIDIGGSNTSRSLTITPIVDVLGDAFITVIVSDTAGLSASSSFLLTVDPQQASLQQFVRDLFAVQASGEPVLINAIAFDQDAGNDDFADLINQQ